jgi:hypothetical protein
MSSLYVLLCTTTLALSSESVCCTIIQMQFYLFLRKISICEAGRRLEDVKILFKQMGVDWIHLVQDPLPCTLKMRMNFQVP